MGNTWIIDVLDDLAAFARRNDMTHLGAQLALATAAANAEIAAKMAVSRAGNRGETPFGTYEHGIGPRGLSRSGGAGSRA